MSVEQKDIEEFSELVAATRALLLSEKSRGVLFLPVTPSEEFSAAMSEERGSTAGWARRNQKSPAKTEEVKRAKTPVMPSGYSQMSPELLKVYQASKDCTKCSLAQNRTNVLFGVGPNDADLMVIGEAPGAIEDVKGEPFVGPIGEMLDKMLNHVVGLSRSQVYLVNGVKCKVKGGRPASQDDVDKCVEYLRGQILAIAPKVILCFGETATRAIVGEDQSVEQLRGRWHQFMEIPVLVSYNPAYLLKHPKFKRPVFNDLKLLAAKYDEVEGAR